MSAICLEYLHDQQQCTHLLTCGLLVCYGSAWTHCISSPWQRRAKEKEARSAAMPAQYIYADAVRSQEHRYIVRCGCAGTAKMLLWTMAARANSWEMGRTSRPVIKAHSGQQHENAPVQHPALSSRRGARPRARRWARRWVRPSFDAATRGSALVSRVSSSLMIVPRWDSF